jgi:hypothetical protein
MKKYICLECNKPIRKNSKSDYIHRACWISLRGKDERHLDYLFCKDRKREMAKTLAISTTEPTHLEDAITEIKELINDEKPAEYELDSSITYSVDIAGNSILI